MSDLHKNIAGLLSACALWGCGDGEPVEIALRGPAEFDFLTREEVLSMRCAEVANYSQLAPNGYAPNSEVFGPIGDGAPWWGLDGICRHGAGKQSIDGDSWHSLFVLNPYLLVVPVGYACSKPAQTMTWLPAQSRAEVTYAHPFGPMRLVGFTAYNAKDMGWPYVFFSEEESVNVSVDMGSTARLETVDQYFHVGNSCGYPGGCNNMSPRVLVPVQVEATPAHAHFRLWRSRPSSPEEPADFAFVVRFE